MLFRSARAWQVPLIDCQQDTAHLASLGARTLSRSEFLRSAQQAMAAPSPLWRFETVHWQTLLAPNPSTPNPP